MKTLVIGLGSMGKRRIRNLRALGQSDIVGYDIRPDRQAQGSDLGIPILAELNSAKPDAAIIATPPDTHAQYLSWCVDHKIPCFVELNVVRKNLDRVYKKVRLGKTLVAPSCTMMFHPAIHHIMEWVSTERYGKVTNWLYHSGQYLPDWHPWETVKDFFVNKPETSGCQELLAFELNWISKVLGMPQKLTATGKRVLGFGLSSDDTLGVHARFKDFLGVLLIDVVSRFATRRLTLNLEKAQIRWDWEERCVRLYSADTKAWTEHPITMAPSADNYNPNITETMYVEELRAFFNAVQGKATFPSTLDNDIAVLKLMETL